MRTIQAGVDKVAPTGLVVACPGVYQAGAVISKALTVQGDPGAVIDASNDSTAFELDADHITISGLTIRNDSFNVDPAFIAAAITSPGITNNITIANNVLTNSLFEPIDLVGRGEVFEGNRLTGSISGAGVEGIFQDSRIVANYISGNSKGGVLLDASDNSSLGGNVGNLVEGNIIANSQDQYGGGGPGILLQASAQSPLRNNRVIGNIVNNNKIAGILLDVRSRQVDVSGNDLVGNSIGKNLGGGYRDPRTTGIYLGSLAPVTIALVDNYVSDDFNGVFRAGPVFLNRSGNTFVDVAHAYPSIGSYVSIFQ